MAKKIPTQVPSQVKITFRKKPTKIQIHKALDEIFKLNGCPACGFNGIISGVHFDINPNPVFIDLQKKINFGPEVEAIVDAAQFQIAHQ